MAGIGVLVVAIAIFFVYSADQAKIRGQNFGSSLQMIQDEMRQIQNEFYSKKTMMDEDRLTGEEFLAFSQTHLQNMEDLLEKYDTLNPPDLFSPSVKLFKMSTQKQLESDRHLIEWIRSGDESEKIRSDLLLQESFADEIAALASYSRAKERAGQN